jgi:NADH-quinone oxidoreductase subunit N
MISTALTSALASALPTLTLAGPGFAVPAVASPAPTAAPAAAALDAAAAEAFTPPIVEKLSLLVPEMILFVAASLIVMFVGLSRNASVRKLSAPLAGVALVAAGVAAILGPAGVPGSALPALMPYSKAVIAGVGVLLLMLLAGTVDRGLEAQFTAGRPFESLRSSRGEFYAFFLFSMTGLMLCATADDLIWLFLALELTSLPTYVMVAISSGRGRAQEAGVKYFFLGAFGAATFLMGFTLLYGATGTTLLFGPDGVGATLRLAAEETGSIGAIGTLGLVLSMIGVLFKIAAVPMHFYTPDVYQGAATPVSAMLAFVPKTAGFLALMLLASSVGWVFTDAGVLSVAQLADGATGSLPEPVRVTLWAVAALTMTVGNTLALQQTSIKRILAYSSIAHSGYMLVGLIAGPGPVGGDVPQNGLGAILFYLLCYGVMNLGAFAVVACLATQRGEDVDHIDDLKGLSRSHPLLGWTMTLSSVSLLGLPLAIGFFGKLYLFSAGLAAGEILLVVVLGLNSAIAALYYLKMTFYPLLESRDADAEPIEVIDEPARKWAGVISAAGVLALLPFVGPLMSFADAAGTPAPLIDAAAAPAEPDADIAADPAPAADRGVAFDDRVR